MEQDIAKKFEEQDEKLEKIFASVEKTRKYFFWTLIITVAVLVFPLIGILFLLPGFLSIYGVGG